MKYCSKCGEMLSTGVKSDRERKFCNSCGFIVFQNPVPVAVVLASLDDKILLVKRAHGPLQGYWAPPSGYIEIDETLEEGAAREVREETGYEVEILELLALHSRANTGVNFTVYRGRIIGGELERNEEETLDAGLFSIMDIPMQSPSEDPGAAEIDRWFYEVVSELLKGLKFKYFISNQK